MPSIKFVVKSKKNPCNLYIRLYQGRPIDITCKTGFMINPRYWSYKQQRITTGSNTRELEKLNPTLDKLKEFITNSYNDNYSNGGSFDKSWLQNQVVRFSSQSKDEFSNPEIYLIPFIEKYIKESETRINPTSGKFIDKKTIQKYETTLRRLIEFKNKTNKKLKFVDIGLPFHQEFLSFLKIVGNYGGTTVEKYISQIKMFCREAKTLGYKTNPEFEHRSFTAKRDKTIDTYLNEDEIDKIFNFDFNYNEELQNTRQLMIIGLWTALRISDLKGIHSFNFTEDKIEIIDSKKTGGSFSIPLHKQVKEILKENEGKLPLIFSDIKFNRLMKIVCQEVGIDKVIMGKKFDKKTRRKVKGYYPKYELVSSHTFRRSFASNLYGKLPNRTIMFATNHKSEAQFIKYVKITDEEHFEELDQHWKNEENK